MKIGVFDSGFGGLNILRVIIQSIPQYDYVYFGDSARTPYGSRSQEIIYDYTKQSIDFLFKNDCSLVIIACNTASAEALRKIQQQYLPKYYPDKKVLGVIIPACEEASKISINKKIGVLATESTIVSEAFDRELKKLDANIEIFSEACPLLVPIVEAGERDTRIINAVIEKYLKPILKNGIDTLIMGCTHYGSLENEIQNTITNMGYHISIINENKIVAEKLKSYLVRHPEIESKLSKNNTEIFYSSDQTDRFQKLGATFIGRDIKVIKVNI